MRRIVLCLLALVLLVPVAEAAEPPLLEALLVMATRAAGVRPTVDRVSTPRPGTIIVDGLHLAITDPAEPANRLSTRIERLVFSGVGDLGDGRFRIAETRIDGIVHDLRLFSMEVLQIDALYGELGIDPPGAAGMARAERVTAGTMTLRGVTIAPATLLTDTPDFDWQTLSVDRAALDDGSGARLAVTDVRLARERRRLGLARRYHVGAVALAGPWLAAVAGPLAAELGYGELKVALEAMALRTDRMAAWQGLIRVGGAVDLGYALRIVDLPAGAMEQDTDLPALIEAAPDARIGGAHVALTERGLAGRVVALVAARTGEGNAATASALAAEAAGLLRRMGARRLAGEAGAALERLLLAGGRLVADLPPGPLARLAGPASGSGALALEAAGLTLRAE